MSEYIFNYLLELHLGGAQRRGQARRAPGVGCGVRGQPRRAPRQQVWRVLELVEHLLEVGDARIKVHLHSRDRLAQLLVVVHSRLDRLRLHGARRGRGLVRGWVRGQGSMLEEGVTSSATATSTSTGASRYLGSPSGRAWSTCAKGQGLFGPARGIRRRTSRAPLGSRPPPSRRRAP
eukprot:scaffold26785_cov51-Phaeocystis_antarctica.AAC.1